MSDYSQYETVIGLEVHAQLLSKSKLFCGDSIEFGNEPNTQVSPITLAHPGTLPRVNQKAIEYAVRMGLACECEISPYNYFDRKNYFYPDLPKGYQVSQHAIPICKGGFIEIGEGKEEMRIRLHHIHLEEDAGKSIHDADKNFTCIDFNRAGTALIEIVSEPDLRSGQDAFAYLTEIRKRVRYLGICNGNMEEGSLRCDANVSVRKKGDTQLGTRVEIKNLNSMRNVKRAIEYESKRLIDLLEKEEIIVQQTLSFDADKGITFPTREKEEADDYRYFPEPDLPPIHLTGEFIKKIKDSLPVLQKERIKKYVNEYQLSAYDASLLTDEKPVSDYFEELIKHTNNYKAAANWMLGPVKTWLNENENELDRFPVTPGKLGSLIMLVEDGMLSFTIASGKVLSQMLKNPEKDPGKIASEQNLLQQSDVSSIEPIIELVLQKFPDKVAEYKKGKKGLMALFVGEVMKHSRGKADPKVTNELLLEKLKS